MPNIRLPTRDRNTSGRAMTHYLSNLRINQESNVINSIKDDLGNIITSFSTTDTPVNYIVLTNAPTNTAPVISVDGSDANISLTFSVKETGVFNFRSSGATSTVVTWEDAANSKITFTMPMLLAADRSIAWPDASGTVVLSPGSTDIQVVGTISVGTWEGGVIQEAFGGTGNSTYELGDTLYADATNSLSKLAGNITTTAKALMQTGTGTTSAAPSWQAITAGASTYTYPGSLYVRTIQSRLEDRVSVKDFGAVGDGVTDDTAAIQLALNTARNIFMPPGTYRITSPVTISFTGQTLNGSGESSCVISSESAGAALEIAVNVEYLIMTAFKIVRPLAFRPATAGMNGITFLGYVNLVYMENIFVEFCYTAYELNVTGFSYIHNCWASQCVMHGFYCHQGTTTDVTFQWTMNRCFVQVCGGNGYYFRADNANASVGEMINCVTYGNTGNGMLYEAVAPYGLYGVRITGGFVGSDDLAGIRLNTNVSFGNKISGAYFELCGTNGIQIDSGSGRTVISDCFLTINNWNGIYSATNELNISGTTVIASGQAAVAGKMNGIHIAAGRVNISNCQIIYNNEYGILVNTDGNSITSNDLSSNSSGPFGSTTTVTTTQLFGNLPSTQATSISLSAGLKDTNSNIVLGFGATASAVNAMYVTNAATGTTPYFSAVGTDANISAGLLAKGTGTILLRGSPTTAVTFSNLADGTKQLVHNINSLTTSRTATWPDASGTVILSTGIANLLYTYPSGVARTLQSRLQDIVSVKDFGAVGDNVADDTTAFQLAIATARNIYVPAGTYKITGTLTFSVSGQSFWGAGRKVSILSSSAAGHTIAGSAGVTWVELRDLRITKPASALPAISGQNGINFAGSCNLVLIENVEVFSHWVGYALGPTGYSSLNNCLADSNYSHGYYFSHAGVSSGPFQWTLRRCLSEFNDGYGFMAEATNGGASMGEWLNVDTFANKLGGVYIKGSAGNPVYSLRYNGGFVGQDGGHELHIDGYSSSVHKISNVFAELGGTLACGVGQTTAAPNTGSGIVLGANDTHVQMVGCHIEANSDYGVYSESTRLQATGCSSIRAGRVSGTANRDGFRIVAGSAYLSNCMSQNNTGYGFYLTGDTHTLIGNYTDTNVSGGIFGTVTLDDSQIIGNIGFASVSNVVLGNLSLSGLTANRALTTNGGNTLTSSSTTATELGYVNGVTSAIQTQIDGKSATAGNTSLVTVGTITTGTWSATTIAVNKGGTGVTAMPKARATMSADQSLASGSPVKVVFDTETFDTNSNYDPTTNYRFTPTIAGKFGVDVSIEFETIATVHTLTVYVYKNGAEYSRSRQAFVPGTTGLTTVELRDVVDMNGSTDYLEIYAAQNAGTNKLIYGTAVLSRVCYTYLP